MSLDRTKISIMGEEVSARIELKDIHELYFLPDNPRVYAAVRGLPEFKLLKGDELQNLIYEQMLKEPSVRKLQPEIERDGGLQESILVRWDKKQVIDGNSRLAVYRNLHEKYPDDERWKQIRCTIVSTLTQHQQTRLLGQTHLLGRTEWNPYSQALLCYRWVVELKNRIEELTRLSSFSVRKINSNIKIIELMRDNNDHNLSNFSHYEQLVRRRTIASEIQRNRQLQTTLLRQIKKGAFTAMELRDQLPFVIAKPKILKRFEREEVSLEEAFDRAKISDLEKRLKSILGYLVDVEIDEFEELSRPQVRAVEQVVRKIVQETKRIRNMIESKL